MKERELLENVTRITKKRDSHYAIYLGWPSDHTNVPKYCSKLQQLAIISIKKLSNLSLTN